MSLNVSMSIEGDPAAALARFSAAFQEEALRPAARAGALVFYNEMRRKAPVRSGKLRDAIYHAFADKESRDDAMVYRTSINARKAPHWHLVEYGYMRRYVSYQGNDGRVRLAVRPGMEGRKAPRRRASQAEKDAYWIPLPNGPVQVLPQSYLRHAWDVGQGPSMSAMRERLREKLEEILGGSLGASGVY